MKRFPAFVCFLALLLTGCAAPADPDAAQESIQVIAMDTVMRITTYGEQRAQAASACEDVIRDLEKQFSRTVEDSAVSQLNATGTLELGELEEDLVPILNEAERCRRETDGAFDITVAPLAAAWGFAGGETYRVPSQKEIDGLLPLVDGSAVAVEDRTVTLGAGQAIDLGGIAKGYAADQIAKVLRGHGIPRANISLGGNVLAWGGRPDGTPWRVGIQDPADPNGQSAFAGILELTDSFAVTSGSYQRYFEENGKRYHHIINPATGYPADSGLASVTVVADCGEEFSGTMCDAFSTALFVMGEEKTLDFWRNWSGTPFELVLVAEDGRVLVTEGLADRFTLSEGCGYTYEVVS